MLWWLARKPSLKKLFFNNYKMSLLLFLLPCPLCGSIYMRLLNVSGSKMRLTVWRSTRRSFSSRYSIQYERSVLICCYWAEYWEGKTPTQPYATQHNIWVPNEKKNGKELKKQGSWRVSLSTNHSPRSWLITQIKNKWKELIVGVHIWERKGETLQVRKLYTSVLSPTSSKKRRRNGRAWTGRTGQRRIHMPSSLPRLKGGRDILSSWAWTEFEYFFFCWGTRFYNQKNGVWILSNVQSKRKGEKKTQKHNNQQSKKLVIRYASTGGCRWLDNKWKGGWEI